MFIASALNAKQLAAFEPRVSRERPRGLIKHVLTVLVFWSWVLLLPRLPPSSRSLRLFPWASILLHGPLDICLDLLPAAPLPPVQKRDAQHMFLQHRGAHADNGPILATTSVQVQKWTRSPFSNKFKREVLNLHGLNGCGCKLGFTGVSGLMPVRLCKSMLLGLSVRLGSREKSPNTVRFEA